MHSLAILSPPIRRELPKHLTPKEHRYAAHQRIQRIVDAHGDYLRTRFPFIKWGGWEVALGSWTMGTLIEEYGRPDVIRALAMVNPGPKLLSPGAHNTIPKLPYEHLTA